MNAELASAREDTNGRGRRGPGDLVEAVRALVVEDGMSTEEVEAVLADALREMGWHPETSTLAKPCKCTRPLVLLPGTCVWCGRLPAREETT